MRISDWSSDVCSSDLYIIIYCEEGKGWVQVGDDKFNLSKKHALIIPAATPHVYAADKQFPWSIYWIHFTGRHVAHYAPMTRKVLNTETGPENNHGFRIELFESIFQNLSNGYLQDNLEYSSVCLRHFLASFMYLPQFNRLSVTDGQDIVNTSLAYMKDHLENKLTLADIAGAVNYSPTYFGPLFKERPSSTAEHP